MACRAIAYLDPSLGAQSLGSTLIPATNGNRPTSLCTLFRTVFRTHRRALERLERGGAVFVCGNARTMAPEVRATLLDIHRTKTGGSAADAWLTALRTEDRFLEDIWG